MIENSNTVSALLTRLKDFSKLKVLDNTSIEEITYGPDTEKYDLKAWPVLHIPSGPIAARLLVGADGPNSLVRKFAKIESRGWSYERTGVVATLKCEPTWIAPTAWQRFLTTGPIAHLPVLSACNDAYKRCPIGMRPWSGQRLLCWRSIWSRFLLNALWPWSMQLFVCHRLT